MQAYLTAFVNFKQNNWVRVLPMAEFAYNNAKNASTAHTLFELNYGYHPRILYKEDIDSRSQSKSADELSQNLKSWWLFVEKISIMPKNFKNELTIRKSNLGAKSLARKFGWRANVSRPSITKSWRQSSLGYSGCFTMSRSKHIS